MGEKVIIVGGVAGGASSAARLRRLNEDLEIILFERDEYISFANCGLPYYIGENIKEREKLLVQTPESMNERFNIDVRINSEVIKVDTINKKVTVKNIAKGIYEEAYDYLVLSPGAKALRPNISGINSSKILTLRNIPDTDRIKNYVDNISIQSAIVIGGGFIGVEMAENLKDRGLEVTLIEAAPHILAPFDSDISPIAEKELQDNGVGLILGDGVKQFEDTENGVDVTLNSKTKIHANIVILAIGVAPDTEFIKDSGIEFGKKGHILVNERMSTNIENIFAVGDAVEVVDFINGQKTTIPLAGPANKQGRIAADNICGINSTYKGTQGTSIIKVFGLTGASTGNNERTLRNLSIPYKVIYVHPQSHASYYPGATPMSLKLIFNDAGKILGAQIFGYDGVDKRIDDIATVIRLNGTVTDLTELELAYAPPYSSAKDPINMAGYTAENVLTGKVEVLLPSELKDINKENSLLLDVRTELEFSNGCLEGAIHIPLDDLRKRLNEIDKTKKIIVYCQIGLRGYIAARILTQKGYTVKNLTGGYNSYKQANFKPDKISNNKFLEKKDNSQQIITNPNVFDKVLDACGLCCPGPLMQVKSNMDTLEDGQILKVTASDPGFYADIKSWCEKTNNELISLTKDGALINALIRKSSSIVNPNVNNSSALPSKDNKTIVVFSGDLDKAIASFIIAHGAASMGKKVTMFFTFWGLNILRHHKKIPVKKGVVDKMFSAMMPRGSRKLKLSNMNMMGLGTKMMRAVMKSKNVSSLEELIIDAENNGIEIVACQMSMDVMGLKKEELIKGVKIGGVGYYLGEAEDSNLNLFI